MNRTEIEAGVKEIINMILYLDESEFTEQSLITNDLGADSLDTIEMVMEAEKKFKISLPDNEAESLKTVKDAIDLIEKKLG